MDRILNQPPPPPPQNVAAIEPDIRGATTIREQLSRHRHEASCAACHARFDPPGFALESFDVIGGWRDRYRAEPETARDHARVFMPEKRRAVPVGLGPTVDASGEFADGRVFHDFTEFRRVLLSDPDQLARALTAKLLVYSTGSGPRYADRAAIEAIVSQARTKRYGFRTLIHEIVQSQVFLQQ